MKKIYRAIILVLWAAFIGGLVGALTAGFLRFIDWGQHFLWNELSKNLLWQSLILCTLGGVLVGLCQRFLGDHPKNINEAVSEIIKTGRLEYAKLPNGLLTVSASLIFGASLGPEAAIVDLLGGLGTLAGDMITWLRTHLELPRPTRSKKRLMSWLQNYPGLIAIIVGTFAFAHFLGGLYSGGFLHFREPFSWDDLLWSIPFAFIGLGGGVLFLFLQKWLRKLTLPMKKKPIISGTLSGFFLGLTAQFLPLILFSGQHQLQQAYDKAIQLGFWVLFLIALARLVLINLLLAMGWKGGQFLPMMFASAALGLAITVMFPIIAVPAAVLGVMAALLAVVLPKPIIALILMALMFPLQYIGITVVAVGLVMVCRRLWKNSFDRLYISQNAME